jgi:hypothetical protein
MADLWTRAHRTTLTIDGVTHPVEVARLSLGALTNLKYDVRMLALQQARLEQMADVPVAAQIAASVDEHALNLHLGQRIEDTIRAGLRPVTPWVATSGVAVTDGASYVEAYGNDDLLAAFWCVYLANTVGVTLAKNSPSPRDSGAGSAASETAARGDAPAPIAAPVDAPASAPSAAVSAPIVLTPSGMTGDTSSPIAVPSAV